MIGAKWVSHVDSYDNYRTGTVVLITKAMLNNSIKYIDFTLNPHTFNSVNTRQLITNQTQQIPAYTPIFKKSN